jgi:hypothetical protein
MARFLNSMNSTADGEARVKKPVVAAFNDLMATMLVVDRVPEYHLAE